MATYQEIQELLVKVSGREDLADLVKRYKDAEQAKADLDAAVQKEPAYAVFRAHEVKAAADQVAALARELKNAVDGADGARSKLNGLNAAVRNVGYGISDVFSNNGPLGQKIQGFANNVSNMVVGVTQALGKTGPQWIAAGAALEIAFTATGAALTAAGIKSVDDLVAYFTGGVAKAKTELAGLEDRVKELTSKPHLIPIEMVELDNAKRRVDEIRAALDAVNRLEHSQAHFEAESGKAVSSAISEATDDKGNLIGGKGVYDALHKQIMEELKATDGPLAEAAKKQEELEAQIVSSTKSYNALLKAGNAGGASSVAASLRAMETELQTQKDAQTRIQTELTKRADLAVGAGINAAEKGAGKEQADAQRVLADRARRAGLTNVAAGIEGASPEAVKAKDLRKKADEKRQRLEDMLRADGDDEDYIATQMAKIANLTDKELDRVIHDTQQSIAEGKREAAKAKKAAAEKAKKDALNEWIDKEQLAMDSAFEQSEEGKAKAADRQQDRVDAHTVAAAQRTNRENVADLTRNTDIDERATAALAQMRAVGGVVNGNTGRVTRLTPQEMESRLVGLVRHELEQAGMGKGQAISMAAPIVNQARESLDAQTEATRMQMAHQGVQMNQEGQQAVNEAVAAMTAMVQQQAEAAAQWGAIAQRARAIKNFVQSNARR